MMSKKVVAVGMSGGVDSSVTAYLLQKQGYEVIGITMKHWGGIEDSKNGKSCCTIDDVYDAKRVCDQLGIPHYTVNFMEEFKKRGS
jgi:tRNA-specific 2-thiouridylase